jgi:preprotein translocase subunit SecE
MALNNVAEWPQKTRLYIDDLRTEMKRVTWPSWKSVRATTGVVIAAVFLFAAYFFVVDAVVNAVITRVIHYFTHA